ncbi:P-loop containing nucleoside triphosphate hydrolase protein [Mycena albidolilacea]|uniref:DNA 3'-5' helicase n=1 Tax=Mycena albidolilacea TaxID=1033008 RepID=A0AAD6ZNB7_9AGAR|nr:P-loop containing nucleoside triphosphate hydrolase protein [Mycena albidolilacea]
MFSVPIIVLREVARNRHLYPDLPFRTHPLGIVVTPTKGLASNIVRFLSSYEYLSAQFQVLELSKLDVPAFAWCHETVTEARKTGRKLVAEITECKTFNIICVDPEHLRERAWREITDSETFRANIVFGCTDEAHLINDWVRFRPHFKNIDTLFRGWFPPGTSVIALSATLQPGPATRSVCETLGFSGDKFHILRLSNERPNIQFIMKPLEHGLGSTEFPQLLEYLNSGRKGVVHCRTIDTVFRVSVYLWNALPPGPARLLRVKTYHSLRTAEDNEEILRLLDEDPMCQVVVSTVAFANGLNAKSLLDSLSLGFPDTVDQMWQEKGRVGRDSDSSARGVVFYQPSDLLNAQRQLSDVPNAPRVTSKSGRLKKPPPPMEVAKAHILTETKCYNAAMNRIYQNPPHEITLLDCLTAKRSHPCSLCATRGEISLDFPTLPLPSGITLPSFTPIVAQADSDSLPKKLKLKKKERKAAEPRLVAFGEMVRLAQYRLVANQSRPKSSYFPSRILTTLLDKLLLFDKIETLNTAVHSWPFYTEYKHRLFGLVRELRSGFLAQRETARLAMNAKARATRRAKKGLPDSEPEDEEAMDSTDDSGVEEDLIHHPPSSPIPPPAKRKKSALVETTNQPRSSVSKTAPSKPRTARKPLEKLAEVAASFRPAYNTSRRTRN